MFLFQIIEMKFLNISCILGDLLWSAWELIILKSRLITIKKQFGSEKLIKTQILKIILLIIALGLVGCSPATSNLTEPMFNPTNAPINTPEEIITTPIISETSSYQDSKNCTYVVDGQTITLVDGYAEQEITPESASKRITRYFGNEINIDLNSDGLMDSVLLLQQESGGSGLFYYVVAAIQTKAGCSGTNAILLGDRIAPQSTNVDTSDSTQFIVNYADRKSDEPMSSSPTEGISRVFKLENGVLVEVSVSSTATP